MDRNQQPYTVKDILTTEVAPALGCTEPIAIALATAAAASLMPTDTIERIEIWVDPNIYKNGIAVAIPGAQGNTGLDLAAAIGALGGDPERRLEVLEPVTEDIVAAAKAFIASGRVTVNLLEDQKGLFIKGAVTGNGKRAICIISDYHDNIVSLTLNDSPILNSPILGADDNRQTKTDPRELEAWLTQLTLKDLMRLIDDLDAEDLAFIREGVRYNVRLAEYGLKFGSGLGIGKTLERLVRQKLIRRDMILAARILTSAASDARMQGVNLPAMSSAGSGNHGLTAVLPIWAVKDYVDCETESVLEAICLSHIITAYVKAHTGRLTAVCGCSVAAGAGATAGVTYLLGGDHKHIAGAIMNLTEDLAGIICDGAKAGCSLKLATAAGTAVQAALFALQGVHVQATDGIISASPEATMKNVGELSVQGMVEADRTILKIMLKKQFGDVS
ncbi:FIG00597135: hypothetical protein [Olavius algarvensis associated proteobacterium Delta 3]|nr:FIG00597135: hypothetical protein [Olavius algarvensis associated proteobacterium Delta 3]CAB5156640.1 FIG00597135: hypothetical protein [Olavius algarvensis associated proteobacterium Delta 3]